MVSCILAEYLSFILIKITSYELTFLNFLYGWIMGGENLDFLTYLVLNKVFGYIKVDFQQY